ncbi:GNAT family N-acetyltransferase [Paenibacillus selenitireducens]|uniref:GNAT family N-acetyltransferase n=1 Tax=Paenibacillus selenitireducens TaxID=1324314 RepID=A0A1T2XDD4_9BACL|nr:GNAT family N-acetyltransferase [Paenibacillus selenitireducens]OPA77860.1 GNAT family N-acetyltransferase [Paenibacillus selenitireducens]
MIQPIIYEDLESLRLLYEELIGEAGDLSQMESVFRQMKSNSAYHLLGYKKDGELLGSVMGVICHDLVGTCRPFMVVENVIVSAKAQGMGAGKKLMQALEQLANENDCLYIMFCSSSYRKDAHRFYESLGYKLDEVQGFRKML